MKRVIYKAAQPHVWHGFEILSYVLIIVGTAGRNGDEHVFAVRGRGRFNLLTGVDNIG